MDNNFQNVKGLNFDKNKFSRHVHFEGYSCCYFKAKMEGLYIYQNRIRKNKDNIRANKGWSPIP